MSKYKTEEERKETQREAQKRYYQNNRDKINEKRRVHYKQNKEKILEQQAEYYQNNREKKAEYYQNNREKKAEYYQNNREKKAEYYQNNRDKINKRHAEYCLTPYGRASYLNEDYKHEDKKYNRGECTLTPQWIVDNIFSQPCHYCGETDWRKIGCDRIDNALPHTPSNVVPCCGECNRKRNSKTYDEFIHQL